MTPNACNLATGDLLKSTIGIPIWILEVWILWKDCLCLFNVSEFGNFLLHEEHLKKKIEKLNIH